jgi:hypothetical protein
MSRGRLAVHGLFSQEGESVLECHLSPRVQVKALRASGNAEPPVQEQARVHTLLLPHCLPGHLIIKTSSLLEMERLSLSLQPGGRIFLLYFKTNNYSKNSQAFPTKLP